MQHLIKLAKIIDVASIIENQVSTETELFVTDNGLDQVLSLGRLLFSFLYFCFLSK